MARGKNRRKRFQKQVDSNGNSRVRSIPNASQNDGDNEFVSSELEGLPSEDGAVETDIRESAGEAEAEALLAADNTDAALTSDKIIGYVNFDGGRASSSNSMALMDFDLIPEFRRGKYVKVFRFKNGKREGQLFLGRLVAGPYYTPDYVGVDSSIARAAIQKANQVTVLPDYHAAAEIELLGVMEGRALYGLSTRPAPQSRVCAIEGEELVDLIGLRGDMELGRLDGYDGIRVNLHSDQKKVLPRNVGIFGTVGSGKTNTSQLLIEQASAAGWAVIVLDVEGEYCLMNMPQDEPAMVARLREVGSKETGISDFDVYHPVCIEPDDEINATPFGVPFRNLSPYMVAELLGMNDTQEDRFLQLYDACYRNRIAPELSKGRGKGARGASAADVIERDTEGGTEEDTTDSSSTSENKFGSSINDLLDDDFSNSHVTLQLLVDRVSLWLDRDKDDRGADLSSRSSWGVVKRLLLRLQRYRLFDTSANAFPTTRALSPGRVSVVNLSTSNEARVNNLVIADILQSVFRFKMEHQDPKVLIVIEEAHTFVSKENVRRMQATMERLREIARRGRKRWLSLAFISQQPSHLPAELYELCNNLFVHETKGSKNLEALKSSAGAVNEAIWSDVPTLGQGRAVIISPQYRHPILARMNPSSSKRRMTD